MKIRWGLTEKVEVDFVHTPRLIIIAKGFLKLPNLPMLIESKILSLSRKLALITLGKLLIVFSTK